MEKGQIVELKIEDMTADGNGIGKVYAEPEASGLPADRQVTDSEAGGQRGFAVFVKGAVYGDRVRAELTKVKKNYAFAKVLDILEESEDRQEPVCEYSGICGGCAYSCLSYDAELQLKEKQVREKLIRLGGLAEPVILPIVGASDEPSPELAESEARSERAAEARPKVAPVRYRNKASMPVSTGGLITEKGGIVRPVHEPRIGFYQPKSHEVVDCEDCLLQSEPAMAAARALRQFMEEDHITSYDPRWDKGLLRHMIVRTAAGTGEVMVILVINGKAIPNAQKLIEMLDDAIYNVPVYEEGPLAGVEFNLESVVLNINKSKKLEGQILGEECITIAGKPTITEEVGGLKFEISPLSFYQVNRDQMIRLYGKALEYASLKGDETVLDLYCGVGTIGLFAAAQMQGGRVIGIESVKGAVLDANRNATINGIVNARYVCGKAEEELPRMVANLAGGRKDIDEKEQKYIQKYLEQDLHIEHADVVILDPPRAGCETALLEAVTKTAPDRIVYVSCDPATLARDIKWLGEHGYEFIEATPFDMFPRTASVECVALLTRKDR